MKTQKYSLNLLAPKSLVTLSSFGEVLRMRARLEKRGILFRGTYLCNKRIKMLGNK